jgi:hypothetical protein
MSPITACLPSIISMGIGCFFVTSGNLWQSIKSLSMKHVEAPESNKAWNLILLESSFNISETIKQREAWEVRIGPLIKDWATFSSSTIPIMIRHLRFLIQYPPPLIRYSLKHFEPYVVSRLKLL